MSRLRRFLHLERARSAPLDPAEPSAGTAERIRGVERPGRAPDAPRATGADLDRFGPEPPPSLELAEPGSGAQPFVRCMRCGMDHHRSARACGNCGAALDTPAQRAFNEELWARRQAEAGREAAAEAERRAAEERARAELDAARRAMGETLAREVEARERRRLGGDSGWLGGASSEGGGPPLGLRIFQALPDWRWQLGFVAVAVGVLGGLLAYGLRGHPGALLGAILLGVLLAIPSLRLGDPP